MSAPVIDLDLYLSLAGAELRRLERRLNRLEYRELRISQGTRRQRISELLDEIGYLDKAIANAEAAR